MNSPKYIPVLIYAGSSDRPDPKRANQVILSRSTFWTRYGYYVEVPEKLLSASALRLLSLMRRDLSGGVVNHDSLAVPHLRVRRWRVGIGRAAEMLGYPQHITADLLAMYGEDGVGEKPVEEAFSDSLLPRATDPVLLARQINVLANRSGLVVDLPYRGGTHIVNAAAAKIDCTAQAWRWKFVLDRAANRARRAAAI